MSIRRSLAAVALAASFLSLAGCGNSKPTEPPPSNAPAIQPDTSGLKNAGGKGGKGPARPAPEPPPPIQPVQ